MNLASPIWAYEFFSGNTPTNAIVSVPPPAIPFLLRGAVNAAANIGNVLGQLSFGFMGDAFGRRMVYGKELIVAIVGIVMVIALPVHGTAGLNDGVSKMWWLFGFRVLLGIGTSLSIFSLASLYASILPAILFVFYSSSSMSKCKSTNQSPGIGGDYPMHV